MIKYVVAVFLFGFYGCMSPDVSRTMKFRCSSYKVSIQQEVTAKLVSLGYSITFANEKIGSVQAERQDNAAGSLATESKMVFSMSVSGDSVAIDVRSVEKVRGSTTVMTWNDENARGATRESFYPVVELIKSRCK